MANRRMFPHWAYEPVEPEALIFAIDIFQGAAVGRIPQPHAPSDVPLELEVDGELTRMVMADLPLTRGMLAVNREFLHLTKEQRTAIVMRVMDVVPFCVAHRERLEQHELLRPGSQGWEVSHAVYRAAAVCPYEEVQGAKGLEMNFPVERFFEIAIAEHNKQASA